MPPIAMPEADRRPRLAARVPVPRAAPDDTAADETAPPAAPAPEAETPAVRRRIPALRRLPHPPGRRAPLWLAALVAGALLAAGPAFMGDPQPVRLDASDYGLGGDVGADLADTGVRRGITAAEARARLSELTASRAAREPKVVVPLNDYRLTTCYCTRWGTEFHPAWDMAAPLGTPIYSAIDGVVLDAGPASGYGNAIYIQDEEGNVHIYGHMRYYSVKAGDIVRAGDQIAVVGNEGWSTGPHVHWQIHQGGRDGPTVDPQAWLRARDVKVG